MSPIRSEKESAEVRARLADWYASNLPPSSGRVFGLGWLLLVPEPTLILATVGLDVAGAIAFGFWIVAAALFFRGWREARVRPRATGTGW